MARATLNKSPSASSFDTRDIPSMGDPDFVDGQVRAMLDEAKTILFQAPNPSLEVSGLVNKWAKEFSPANTDYIQTLSVPSLNKFLRDRGIGSDDVDPEAPVKALVATMLDSFVDAAVKFHEQRIDSEQLQFAIETVVEDMVALVRGLDNPAD